MANPELPRWALVTGASAGIGAAFARELAARGWSLLLTARREERLQALAQELTAKHGIQARVLAADLADPAAAPRLAEYARQESLPVSMLVNNAGYGVPGTLVTQPWEKHRDFIEVMISAPAALCWHFLPGMRERGYGRIVNVASLAGLVPGTPGHTLYAAAKAYLIKLSESLALENRGRGIHVSACCPGFTYSEFHDVVGVRQAMAGMPRWMWLEADAVARESLDAVERGKVVVVNGRVYRLIRTLAKLMPDSLALALTARRARSFRRTQ